MQGELPMYEIKGHPFIVEVEYGLLRSVHDNMNFIEFTDMSDEGTHYEIGFSRLFGIADIYGDNPSTAIEKVPPMVELDPERVAKMYNLKVSDLPKKDRDLRTSMEWYIRRKRGEQPTINIYGHTYFVNVNHWILEPKDLRNDLLRFRDLRADPTNTYYYGMLDTKTMSLIKYDDDLIKEIPQNAVMIKIPNEKILDPFMRLRSMGWEDHLEKIGKFPIRYNFEARVLPWRDTPIPQLIRQKKKLHRKHKRSLKV
ncbi:hypothetical protein FXV77_05265 [Sphingobacterium phlebotomi]|uniref:Uncharacterized protein n=1 Tax=Sphingobacterium phlebotomi TaxID=2605433 RepID=A0A5D4H9Y9_9SPHI|nr:hypothetical protein [Sphingobacterium phlebotomi]TYR37414.1 hypothetical protein FXV77_05265 [Sphingobacterium phlebotomi]